MALIPAISGLDKRRYNILIVFAFQVLLGIIFALNVRYADRAYPQENIEDTLSHKHYNMFIDVHVMIFIGFGFLMAFIRRYVFGGIAFNFIVGALMIQWALVTHGVFNMDDNFRIQLDVFSLIEADVNTATVLISMGAMLGRTTYVQLIVMGFFELLLQAANFHLMTEFFQAADDGDSVSVHVFGAYFGLAASFIVNLRSKYTFDKNEIESTYNSDALAMIGTLFLWIYWPSFNGSMLQNDAQVRAYINTYIALASCCVTAFVMSWLFSEEKKFNMVHIQNSTLAGGVAVGAVASFVLHPAGALIIGVGAGILSVIGFMKLTPILDRAGITDTCGVHNLHGMPGVLSGLVGIVIAATCESVDYRTSLYQHYPAMAPSNPNEDEDMSFNIPKGSDRNAFVQAGYQAAALAATLVIAIVGGLLTGLVMSANFWEVDNTKKRHHDRSFWVIHDITVTPEEQIRVRTVE